MNRTLRYRSRTNTVNARSRPADHPKRTIGVVSAFPPGRNSLNEFGWHVVRSLAANEGIERVVLFADETDAGRPAPIDGVDAVPCWRFNSLTSGARIIHAVRKEQPDAVIFNLQFASFGDRRVQGGLGLLTPALVAATGVPTGVILHNLVENVDMEDAGFASSRAVATLMSTAGRMLTKALLRTDYVALTIPRYVELLRESYGADNAVLIPHGSFETPETPSFDTPPGPRRLLAFGKWGTYKTVDVLIDAYRLLIERGGYDDVEVVIAGTDSPNSPGYLAGVAESTADLPGVRFTGYVEEADVAPLFRDATVAVFPYSSTTGSSGVLHQAGSYGRCAVLPDIGDFTEIIEEEGFTGEYFTPEDATSLADSLARLLDDPARRTAMGKQNFAAASGIPMSEVVDWHLLHIERLLNNGAAAKHK